MALTVVGDSFGGIQQALNAQAALQQAAQQHAANLGLAWNQAAGRGEDFNREMALRQQQFGQQIDLRQQELLLQHQNALRQADMDAQRNAVSQGYLKLYGQQVAQMTGSDTAAQARELQGRVALAQQAALQGTLSDDALKDMPTGVASQLKAMSDQANTQLETVGNAADAAAHLLSTHAQLSTQKNQLTAQITKLGTTLPITSAGKQKAALQAQLDAVNSQLMEVEPRATRVLNDKTLMQLVSPAPDGNGYTRSVPLSPRQQRDQALKQQPTKETAAPPGAATAPAGQPQAGDWMPTSPGSQWMAPNLYGRSLAPGYAPPLNARGPLSTAQIQDQLFGIGPAPSPLVPPQGPAMPQVNFTLPFSGINNPQINLPARTPAPVAAPTAAGALKADPTFHARVMELMQGQNLDVGTATGLAIRERMALGQMPGNYSQ